MVYNAKLNIKSKNNSFNAYTSLRKYVTPELTVEAPKSCKETIISAILL